MLRLFPRLFRKNPAKPIDLLLWQRALAGLAFITDRPEFDQTRLRALAAQFIASKQWHGVGGLDLSDEMVVLIAAQACLPVLHLDLDLYADFVGVVVYPEGFVIPQTEVDEDGIVHEYDMPASGQAWDHGPVLLSWQDASNPALAAGYNVVIHEFAHKLQMANVDAGFDSGLPVFDPRFHAHLDRAEFARTLATSYEAYCAALDALPFDWDEPTFMGLDPYAADSPVEFFAVSTEAMFTQPEALRQAMPAWHRALSVYFGLATD
jgi:Mlc titration factor MtfA (ptsG expression regulator)